MALISASMVEWLIDSEERNSSVLLLVSLFFCVTTYHRLRDLLHIETLSITLSMPSTVANLKNE